MTYYEFDSLESANKVLNHIDQTMGYGENTDTKTWTDIVYHPTKLTFLIAYTDRIAKCLKHFKGYQHLLEKEVIKKGYYLGFHKGRYGKLLDKIEEADLIIDQLKENQGDSFFIIQRNLVLSIAYTFYSIKESLSRISRYKNRNGKIINVYSSQEQENWWNQKLDTEIEKDDELIAFLINLHNTDKHDFSSHIKPKAKYFIKRHGVGSLNFEGNQYMISKDGKIYFGADGFYELIEIDSRIKKTKLKDPTIMKDSFSFDKIQFDYELVGLPNMHLGKKLDNLNNYEVINFARIYFESIVIEAMNKFN
jgi:hypothetical protein